MTLDETLRQVVEANLRLQISSLDHDMALQKAKSEWAIFEPNFLLTVAGEGNERRNNTERFLSQRVSVFDEENRIYSAAVEGRLPTGGKIRMGTQVRALDNNLQSLSAGTEYEAYSGLTLTQPLLRDAGWKAVAAQIKLAAADSKIALQDYRSQLALVLSEAETAYWELSAANEFVALRESSVEVAEAILKDNKNRREAGMTTEIEVLQAEAGLALRKSHLADAKQRRVDAAARLNAFLGRRGNTSVEVTPVERSDDLESVSELDAAIDNGFASHPAYLAQKERIEQAGIRLAYARNERWPQLDLKASYGLNGLDSSLRGGIDNSVVGDFPSWYVGLELNVPMLGGKRERHQLLAAKMRAQQALLELSAIEVELVNGMQALHEQVRSLSDRVSALQKVVELDKRVLKNEREALGAGKSESRKVLEAEEDLSEASIEALTASIDLRRALASYLVQQGAYLKTRGFELPDTEAP